MHDTEKGAKNRKVKQESASPQKYGKMAFLVFLLISRPFEWHNTCTTGPGQSESSRM